MRILVTPTSFNKPENEKARRLLESFADEIVYNTFGRPLTEDEVIKMSEGCDGYIAGLDSITKKAIEMMPSSMRVISRYGAGVDRVDLEAATQKGIIVTNTPGANSDAVADLAFALLLSTARKIPALDKKVRAKEWPRSQGIEVFNKTIGIIGMGSIGKAVARRAKGFSMSIMAYDPYIDKDYTEKNGITACELDELLSKSDFISLHLPYMESTHHIIDKRAIDLLKPGAIIVNTARGGLIDEEAAYLALRIGKLGGLGLDAFEKEPPEDSPLFELDNVVVTPHIGAHTAEAVINMGMMAVKSTIDVLKGEKCSFAVNKDILKNK